MKKIKIDDINEGDYLAEAIYDSNNQLIFYEGTCLQYNHIRILKENKIEEVVIFEDNNAKPLLLIKKEIYDDCKVKVKSVLEKHICHGNASVKEIEEAAEIIMTDIVDKEEIVEKIYEIKERRADIYDHSINVSALSILTALKLNLSKEAVQNIGIGALLHDIGLKYVSVNYKNADVDEFSPENLFEYKKHSIYGFSSMEKESWMTSIAKKIILFHHETMNGTGYPLKQRNIPFEVKIVSVCDTFDDKICGIGCKQIKVIDAIEYIKKYKNIYYEDKIVDTFLKFIALYPTGSKVILNNNEEAEVVRQNEYYTDKPVVKVLKDKNGNKVTEVKEYDLSEIKSVLITEVIS